MGHSLQAGSQSSGERAPLWDPFPSALRHFLRPGPPPTGWLARSAALVGASAAACVLIGWAGHAWHGTPAHYFRENTIGTWLSVGLLIAAGVAGIRIGVRTSKVDPARAFWLALGAFLVYLGVDDGFKLHESVDHAWHRMTGWDPKHGPTAHLDNWIVASYALIAGALFWRHRRYVATLGWFNRTMAAAFAVFAAMVYADSFVFHHHVEDSLKVVAGAMIVCAFLSVRAAAAGAAPARQSRSL